MLTVDFKVVTVSVNKNSFGLAQCIMIAKNGLAYKVCANAMNMPNKGGVVSIPYDRELTGNIEEDSRARLSFAHKGFEIPERIEDAPQEVIDEIWN